MACAFVQFCHVKKISLESISSALPVPPVGRYVDVWEQEKAEASREGRQKEEKEGAMNDNTAVLLFRSRTPIATVF